MGRWMAFVFDLVLCGTSPLLYGRWDPLWMASHQDLDFFIVPLWKIHGLYPRYDPKRNPTMLFPDLQLFLQYALGSHRGMDLGPPSFVDGMFVHDHNCWDSLWDPMLQTNGFVLLSL